MPSFSPCDKRQPASLAFTIECPQLALADWQVSGPKADGPIFGSGVFPNV
jgi:hypothetical protein